MIIIHCLIPNILPSDKYVHLLHIHCSIAHADVKFVDGGYHKQVFNIKDRSPRSTGNSRNGEILLIFNFGQLRISILP